MTYRTGKTFFILYGFECFFGTKSLRHMKLIISLKPQEIKKKWIEKTNFLIVHKHFFWSNAQNNQKNNGKEHLGIFFNRCDRCAPPPPPVPGVDPASLPKVTPDRADWGQRSCHGDWPTDDLHGPRTLWGFVVTESSAINGCQCICLRC